MTFALSSRARIGAVAIALALCAACLFIPGDHIAAVSVRCGAVLVILAAAAAWLRNRAAVRSVPSPLSIAGRCAFGRETGVALLCAGDQRWIVGYGREGVSIIADLGDAP